jgi:hypothetical protein
LFGDTWNHFHVAGICSPFLLAQKLESVFVVVESPLPNNEKVPEFPVFKSLASTCTFLFAVVLCATVPTLTSWNVATASVFPLPSVIPLPLFVVESIVLMVEILMFAVPVWSATVALGAYNELSALIEPEPAVTFEPLLKPTCNSSVTLRLLYAAYGTGKYDTICTSLVEAANATDVKNKNTTEKRRNNFVIKTP